MRPSFNARMQQQREQDASNDGVRVSAMVQQVSDFPGRKATVRQDQIEIWNVAAYGGCRDKVRAAGRVGKPARRIRRATRDGVAGHEPDQRVGEVVHTADSARRPIRPLVKPP